MVANVTERALKDQSPWNLLVASPVFISSSRCRARAQPIRRYVMANPTRAEEAVDIRSGDTADSHPLTPKQSTSSPSFKKDWLPSSPGASSLRGCGLSCRRTALGEAYSNNTAGVRRALNAATPVRVGNVTRSDSRCSWLPSPKGYIRHASVSSSSSPSSACSSRPLQRQSKSKKLGDIDTPSRV